MASNVLTPRSEAILRLCQPWGLRRVPRGCPLIAPAEPDEHLCIVVRGIGKLYTIRADGSQRIVRFTRPYDILGLAALVGRSSVHFATAVTECEVAFLPRERTLSRIRAEAELNQAVIEVLVATVAQLCEQVALPRHDGCERHVASALWYLLRRSGLDDAPPPILLELTHQELADFLGLHRVSVARALLRLSDRGWVRSRFHALEVVDPVRLGAFAGGT